MSAAGEKEGEPHEVLEYIDEDLRSFEQDDMVKAALAKGVDLRQYGKSVDDELKQVERDSIMDYIAEAEELATLHTQIKQCDSILDNMESMLSGFQGDLASISTEIKHLQDESISINIRLRNRKAVEGQVRRRARAAPPRAASAGSPAPRRATSPSELPLLCAPRAALRPAPRPPPRLPLRAQLSEFITQAVIPPQLVTAICAAEVRCPRRPARGPPRTEPADSAPHSRRENSARLSPEVAPRRAHRPPHAPGLPSRGALCR